MIIIRNPKTFCFNFDRPKYADENLKHEIEFIIKSNKPWINQWIKQKHEIEKLLLKHKHENNIHEHRKQQNKWAT